MPTTIEVQCVKPEEGLPEDRQRVLVLSRKFRRYYLATFWRIPVSWEEYTEEWKFDDGEYVAYDTDHDVEHWIALPLPIFAD